MITTGRLRQMIADVYDLRADLRAQGATPAAIQQATENIVRAAWEPLVPPEDTWPLWARAPKCATCDGTGLMIAEETTRVYGEQKVPVGRPCFCAKGDKFRPKPPSGDDFQAAGKKPAAVKQFSRIGR